MKVIPKYPIFVPSKGRWNHCYTCKEFLRWGVDFKVVVVPSQKEKYLDYIPEKYILVLPSDDFRLLETRLWIREYSIKIGAERHWQFDDNIRQFFRLHKGQKYVVNPNIAIKVVEDFTDRYENIGLSGFNYEMFVHTRTSKPFYLNVHVYSATLIWNKMTYKWRLYYNDDTDLCLQVLSNGLCTVLFNVFSVAKIATMVVKGGNTDDLYKKNGRLKMAVALQKIWPQYVEVKWRFGRPQHVVKNNWRMFKQKLIRKKDIDWDNLPKIDNYGLNKIYYTDKRIKYYKELKGNNE